MPVVKIQKSTVDKLAPAAKLYLAFDTDLKGFGVRVMPSGVKTFIVEYRPGAGGRGMSKRRVAIGSAGVITAEEARRQAKAILAGVQKGEDPAGDRAQERAAISVADLCDRYMEEEVRPLRKASTAALYRIYFEKHVKPILGTKKAGQLTRAEVARWHRKIGEEASVTANRALAALSGAFGWAQKAGEQVGSNPCTGVGKFREVGRERYLTGEELGRLSEALQEAEGPGIPWEPDPAKNIKHAPKEGNRRTRLGPYPVAAIRLLLLTGARLREILHLQWAHVDFERGLLMLPDSKTGKKTIMLNAPALSILAALPRAGRFVIAGDDPEKPRADLHRPWALVSKRAGLEGVRLHDLRHTHASIGAGAGLGLQVIGRLLGHAQTSTTERYAHLADDPLRRASDLIARRLVDAMGGAAEGRENVVPLARGSA